MSQLLRVVSGQGSKARIHHVVSTPHKALKAALQGLSEHQGPSALFLYIDSHAVAGLSLAGSRMRTGDLAKLEPAPARALHRILWSESGLSAAAAYGSGGSADDQVRHGRALVDSRRERQSGGPDFHWIKTLRKKHGQPKRYILAPDEDVKWCIITNCGPDASTPLRLATRVAWPWADSDIVRLPDDVNGGGDFVVPLEALMRGREVSAHSHGWAFRLLPGEFDIATRRLRFGLDIHNRTGQQRTVLPLRVAIGPADANSTRAAFERGAVCAQQVLHMAAARRLWPCAIAVLPSGTVRVDGADVEQHRYFEFEVPQSAVHLGHVTTNAVDRESALLTHIEVAWVDTRPAFIGERQNRLHFPVSMPVVGSVSELPPEPPEVYLVGPPRT